MIGALIFRYPGQQFGVHEKHRGAIFRRQGSDAASGGNTRLVAEPVPGSEEDEGQDDSDHHVVLPTGPLVVPENKALQHAFLILASHPWETAHLSLIEPPRDGRHAEAPPRRSPPARPGGSAL